METKTRVIGYCRVSTSEQGQSGLGLEAQQTDIELFCVANNLELVSLHREIASGKGRLENRPILSEVLHQCRKDKCQLIISKVDRLSRNIAAVTSLMESNVSFISVQLGLNADSFSTHLFSALAERERKFISQRTKEALARKKARGEKLGNLASLDTARANGHKTKAANADIFSDKLKDQIAFYQKENMSLRSMAAALNKVGITTVTGKQWYAQNVSNLISRLQSLSVN